MKFSVIAVVVALLPCVVIGQFKTRQYPQYPSSGNLIQASNSTNLYSSGYGSNTSLYPPILAPISRQPIQGGPVYVDKTAEFLNKTRSGMASGICFTEVPTASLVRTSINNIPAGNGSSPSMSKIQICCDGYERNPHVYRKCEPICKDDCPNGICTAPNICVCLPGNVRDYEDNCVPTCPIGCRNGLCQGDGSCLCKPGYTLDPVTKQFCNPQCSKGCNLGSCVAPETCRCLPNYELSANGVCQPKCDNCLHGTCTAPGLCSCDRGYVRQNNVCEPICANGCNKGTCVAPNTCSCKAGFTLDSTGYNCVPHCDKPCLNGVCDGYNACLCNVGYIQDEFQSNVCKAHCPNGCPNGYCTAPNFCICKPGFIKSGVKGRQSCISL